MNFEAPESKATALTPSQRFALSATNLDIHHFKWEPRWYELFNDDNVSRDDFVIEIDPITMNPIHSYHRSSEGFKRRFPNKDTRPSHEDMQKHNMAGYCVMAPFEGTYYPGVIMWNSEMNSEDDDVIVHIMFEDGDVIDDESLFFSQCKEIKHAANKDSNTILIREQKHGKRSFEYPDLVLHCSTHKYLPTDIPMYEIDVMLLYYHDYKMALNLDDDYEDDYKSALDELQEIIRDHIWSTKKYHEELIRFYTTRNPNYPVQNMRCVKRQSTFCNSIKSDPHMRKHHVVLNKEFCETFGFELVKSNSTNHAINKKIPKKKPVPKKKKQMRRKQTSPPPQQTQLSMENFKLDTLLPSLSEQLRNLVSSVRNPTGENTDEAPPPTTTNNVKTLSFENELDGFSLQSELDTAGSSLAEALTTSYVEASNSSSRCSITGKIQINKTKNGMRIITSERSTSQQKPKSHDRNDIDIKSLISNIKQELEADVSRYISKCVSISSNDTVNDTSIDMEESSDEEEPEEEYDETSYDEKIAEKYENFDLKPGQVIAIVYEVLPGHRWITYQAIVG
eukprot:TRINITY_DN3311_c0_g4_i1.p1 TRINITY_DN3311_c0_g4~~TRINITY_DN3311_c0_g4_i1.p1  ORF type:complete len:622 (-),score=128.28 TRINITY_DN3311_c0_g4_i1:555-2246(-)